MTAKISLLLFILVLSFSSMIGADQDRYPFTHMTDIKRFDALTKSIRCVVCQNQSLAESNAPLANDLREKIYQMILENQTDQDIRAYLVKRYGDFILLQPPLNLITFGLWAFPLIAVIIAFFILLRLCYRNAKV